MGNPAEAERRAKDIDGGKNLHKNAKGLLQYTVPTYTKTDNTEEE